MSVPLSLSVALCPVIVLAGPQESVEALIAKGRALLAQGKPVEAQVAFDAAAVQDGASPRTKLWVVRGWIAQWKFDDALAGTDELKEAKAPAADLDYLYGLAFLGLAKQAVQSTGGGPYTQGQFEDATRHLKGALAADATRYSDAWIGLAEAAWYAQQLDIARDAADKAVALEPSNPEAHTLLGRVLFSLYVAEADEVRKGELWSATYAAFGKAIALLGAPTEAWKQSALADAHAQCGNLHAWKNDKAAAARSYADAIGWDPSKVDFSRVRSVLGPEEFLACVQDAGARFAKQFGAADARNATVAWWSGYAQFENAKWAECEASFRSAVALWPAFANSWYYIFRAAFSQQRYPEAIEALRNFMRADPDGLIATLAADFGRNAGVLNGLIGWSADPEKQGGSARNEDAAFLCGIFTKVEPQVARHWNNLGLFIRDQGDALRMKQGKNADAEVLADLWARAYEAYQRSLELAPEDPNFLNDTAVMLHYYLKRDFERAQQMYEHSRRRAEEELARKDLSPDDRAVIEIAKRDSADNLRRLKKYLERRAAGEDIDPNAVR